MKKILRKQMVEMRSSLTQEQALDDSKIIIDKVVAYLRSINANNILIYMDMQKEVMATLLLDYDFNIYITKTLKDNTLKINKYIKEELTKHPFGYYESRSEDYIDGNIIDAIIIPGVAFDTKGNRVGYGKGYYDRLLAQYPNIPRIAVAYDFQVIDSQIETNEFDKKMTMIITEKRSIIL